MIDFLLRRRIVRGFARPVLGALAPYRATRPIR